MRFTTTQRGFTLVEILVAVAILVIITTFSVTAFRNIYLRSAERIAGAEIADALREARTNSIGSKGNAIYGVHISTSTVTRFVGSTYVAGNASNTVYSFDGGALATGTLVTSGTSITFSRLTGTPSATGTIYVVDMDGTSTTTITIESTGLIQ